MLAALPTLSVLLASIFVHSVASAVIWVYAELLLQLTVPNEFMGRVVALEMAAATAASAVSALAAGMWFDAAGLGIAQLLLVLTGLSGVFAVSWLALSAGILRRNTQL